MNTTPKPDGLQEKLIRVKRHAKVTKGGRIFSFSVLMVVGNGKGHIGFAKRSAREVSVAMPKALEKARRNMLAIELNSEQTIYHRVEAKFGATKVIILPATNAGIIAGGPMRAIFEVMGIRNVVAKIIGSRNSINVIRATLKALNQVTDPEAIAEKRGKTLKEIYN